MSYSCFGIKLPRCLIKKKQHNFCHGITAWRICFVDNVASCTAAKSYFLLFNFICLSLLMVNKVDHNGQGVRLGNKLARCTRV